MSLLPSSSQKWLQLPILKFVWLQENIEKLFLSDIFDSVNVVMGWSVKTDRWFCLVWSRNDAAFASENILFLITKKKKKRNLVVQRCSRSCHLFVWSFMHCICDVIPKKGTKNLFLGSIFFLENNIYHKVNTFLFTQFLFMNVISLEKTERRLLSSSY